MSHSYKKIVFQLITKNSHTTEAGHRRASSTDWKSMVSACFFCRAAFIFSPEEFEEPATPDRRRC